MKHLRPVPTVEPGNVLVALDESTLKRQSYDYVNRDGARRSMSINREYIGAISGRTYTNVNTEAEFKEHELRLVQPYTGCDRPKRFCWYFARRFLLTTEELAKDTRNTDAIADLDAEQQRVAGRIAALPAAEKERLAGISLPAVPTITNI